MAEEAEKARLEAEAKAKAEAEAKARAEEEARKAREAKIADLTKKAQDAGLTAEQTTNYANANADKSDADAKAALNAIIKENRDNKIADLAKKATDAGLPQAQADNYANAQADATDADAKAALDKLLADRQAIKDDLKQKALDAGLSNSYSQKYADDNVDTASNQTQAALNQAIRSATVAEKGTSNATPGLSESRGGVSISTVNQSSINGVHKRVNETTERQDITQTYNQEYSVVTGKGEIVEVQEHSYPYNKRNDSYLNVTVKGLETQDIHVPTIGRAAYTGEAFSLLTGDGKFDYLVDFDKRTGSGTITGFNVGTLNLTEGELTKVDLDGKRVTGVSSNIDNEAETISGSYMLGLYGTHAQEVAGKGTINNDDGKTYQIGFGGKQNAERLAEIEAEEEQFAKEKAALLEQAKKVGISDELIKQYIEAAHINSVQELPALETLAQEQAKVEKAKLELYPAVDLTAYQPNADKIHGQSAGFETVDAENRLTKFDGGRYIYQLPYSVVVRTSNEVDFRNDVDFTNGQNARVDFDIAGLATTELGLPAEGKAAYVGRAIDRFGGTATLRYNLDFANRVGSGRIIGYTDSGIINLNEAGITKLSLKGKDVLGITGDAVASKPFSWVEDVNGKYGLGFFGPEAQEIAGSVEFNSFSKDGNYLNKDKKVEFGFGGTRGEITK